MKQIKTPAIDVIALSAIDHSPDRKNVIISLTTKYSDARTYSVPAECLYGLIKDLQKLAAPTGVMPPAEAMPTEAPGQPTVAPKPAEDPNRVNVTVPKKWMLSSGLPNHPLVIMIFDPQTKAQAGYALTAAAAQEMAIGLVKYADTLAKHAATKPKLS